MGPATQASVFVGILILSVKTVYELVLLLKKNMGGKTTPGVYCNYAPCAFASADFQKLRTLELIDGVSGQLVPSLDKQNGLLMEIRDEVKLSNRGKR